MTDLNKNKIILEATRRAHIENPTESTRGQYNLALIKFSKMKRRAKERVRKMKTKIVELEELEIELLAAIKETKKANKKTKSVKKLMTVDQVFDLSQMAKKHTDKKDANLVKKEKKTNNKKKNLKSAAKSAVKQENK